MTWLVVVVICALYPQRFPVGSGWAQASGVSSKASPLTDFSKRVDGYMALEKQVVRKIGPLNPTKSPKEIAARETALGLALRAARAGAKAGDLFVPQAAATFRTIIYNEFKHRSQLALKNRQDSQDELPDFAPMVNQIYPTAYPLATFPPALLRQLPPLPKPLEYRFVRRHLIIRDGEANLIVDVLPDAAPALD
jgi:hypothetical protein